MQGVASPRRSGLPLPRSGGIFFILFFLLAAFTPVPAAVTATSSGQAAASRSPVHVVEIEALIAYVAGLEGATFLRNGSAHTGAEAAAHMRMKWQRQEARIHSAEDFIERCASRSILTGRPYQVRLADGKVREASALLREALKRIRTKSSG